MKWEISVLEGGRSKDLALMRQMLDDWDDALQDLYDEAQQEFWAAEDDGRPAVVKPLDNLLGNLDDALFSLRNFVATLGEVCVNLQLCNEALFPGVALDTLDDSPCRDDACGDCGDDGDNEDDAPEGDEGLDEMLLWEAGCCGLPGGDAYDDDDCDGDDYSDSWAIII